MPTAGERLVAAGRSAGSPWWQRFESRNRRLDLAAALDGGEIAAEDAGNERAEAT
jgi:hypothetical protein